MKILSLFLFNYAIIIVTYCFFFFFATHHVIVRTWEPNTNRSTNSYYILYVYVLYSIHIRHPSGGTAAVTRGRGTSETTVRNI